MVQPPAPVRHVLFEALFDTSLRVEGPLAAELKQLGYDRDVPQASYDASVFLSCLDAARRALHGGLPQGEGQKQLGLQFVAGFQRTILGRVVTTALPLLGPSRFLPRLPGRLKGLRPDVDVQVELTGDTTAVLTFVDSLPLSDFFSGVLEAALALSGAKNGTARPEVRPGGYVVHLSWER